MLRKGRNSGNSAEVLFIILLTLVGLSIFFTGKYLNKPATPKFHSKIVQLYYHISSVPWRNTPEFRKYYNKSVQLMLSANTLKDELKALAVAYIGSVSALGKIGLKSSIYPVLALFLALLFTYGVYYGGYIAKHLYKNADSLYKGNDPISKAISKTWFMLKENPRPASIWYHRPYKGGLFLHSKDVAQRAVELLKESKPDVSSEVEKLTFLLGLAHDIGKIRIYRYENRKLVTPADHTGKKKILRIHGWFSTGAPELSNTKIIFASILKESGASQRDIDALLDTLDSHVEVPGKYQELREIIKRADREITNREIFEVRDKNKLLKAFFDSLKHLNINGIFGKNYEGWYNPRQKVLAVLSWSIARNITENLFQTYGNEAQQLGASLVQSLKNVHPIIPPLVEVLKSEGIIYTKYKNLKGDDLSLFDLQAGDKIFKAVLLIKPEVLSKELRTKWTNGLAHIYNISIKSRIHRTHEENHVVEEIPVRKPKRKLPKELSFEMIRKNYKHKNNRRVENNHEK